MGLERWGHELRERGSDAWRRKLESGSEGLTEKQTGPDSEVNLVMNILPLFSGECAAVHCGWEKWTDARGRLQVTS